MIRRPLHFNLISKLNTPGTRRSLSLLGHDTVTLKYDVVHSPSSPAKGKLVLCHGLFGSKQNFRSLSKSFAQRLGMDVYCVDLRNHGASPHARPMTYDAMAADLLGLLQHITSNSEGEGVSLLGHSMGGKVAMTLALQPSLPHAIIKNLIVEDISPISAQLSDEFQGYVKGMRTIVDRQVVSKKEADAILNEIEPDITVRQFLLTNTSPAPHGKPLSFRIPLEIIEDSIDELGKFSFTVDDGVKWTGPTLVIRGKKSKYIKDRVRPLFDSFFPQNEWVELDTGHWVHAEDPYGFVESVVTFLNRHQSKI